MSEFDTYKLWLDIVDDGTKDELIAIGSDESEIKDRFGGLLDFGTAGLRGLMGAGTNRMNVYTVRHVSQCIAELIKEAKAENRGVVIAYDCRNNSPEFAEEASKVFAANGIVSHLFDSLRPTPELSFAIRRLNAVAGINITASHNPKQYNGYKVYWEDGAQLPPQNAQRISDLMGTLDVFADVRTTDDTSGFVSVIGDDIDEEYLSQVLDQSVCRDAVLKCADDFRIIFTPFHGAGCKLVPEALSRLGFRHVIPVPEQIEPDGNFPTVTSPNPEDKEGFSIAIAMAKEMDVDLIIGTDPDADRVGIVVRADNDYVTMSGNQTGVLLLDYLIRVQKESGTLPHNAAAIKSIVSTEMARAVCGRHGVTLIDVLTGFKYIGEKIKEFEQTNEFSFIFGFEESYGYLSGTYARDKDAVAASLLIAEMACWYHLQGKSLYEAMEDLYAEYGYFRESILTLNISGFDVNSKMRAIVGGLRENPPTKIAGLQITCICDYLYCTKTEIKTGDKTETGLPCSDMLDFLLSDGSRFIVRPSGTEPKIKVYLMVRGESGSEAQEKLNRLSSACRELIAAP